MSRTVRAKLPKRVLKTKRLLLVAAVVLAVAGLGTAGYFLQTANQAPAWQELGRTAARERQYAQAVGFYKQYLEYRPKDADAHFELAGVYDDWARMSVSRPREASRLWDEALSEYHIGLQQDTRRHDERRKLARLYLILQKPQAARKEIDLLLKEESLRAARSCTRCWRWARGRPPPRRSWPPPTTSAAASRPGKPRRRCTCGWPTC